MVDTAHVHYYGNSLGGIVGEVYMASTTDVIRGGLISVCVCVLCVVHALVCASGNYI